MSFATLQDQARLEWTEFERPDQARILVGSATCGRAAGSLEVLQAFAKELDKHSFDPDNPPPAPAPTAKKGQVTTFLNEEEGV